MDIVVKGRNVEVPDHFRQHVSDKLAPSERLDAKVFRIDVELAHEKNPRQSSHCQRLEITARGKGPVIRAEAVAADFYAALDAATLKLEARLRRSHDRRRVHHGLRTPASVAEATATLPADLPGDQPADRPADLALHPAPDLPADDRTAPASAAAAARAADAVALLDRREPERHDDTELLIVRDKTHQAEPMTATQALHEMELVGHDFYLFVDSESGLPSVVYCRHGYDYGVIRVARR